MLTITTDSKQIQLKKDQGATSSFAKSSLYYTVSEQSLSVYMISNKDHSFTETFDNGIVVNGETITSANAAEKLSELFFA